MSRARSLAVASGLVVTALLLAVARAAASPDVTPPTPPTDAREVAGRQIWLGDCSFCHGERGEGTMRGPSLQGVGPAGVDLMVSTGRMPLVAPDDDPIPGPVTYGEAEIAALVAYAATIIDGPGVPRVDLAGADVAAGGARYRAICAACHEMVGQGGILTDGRNVPPLAGEEPRLVVEAMRSGPSDMPQFPVGLIDKQEAVDIAAYVRELGDPRDRGGWSLGHWGPVPEGAAALVFGVVPAVLVARTLGQRNPPAAQEDDLR